MPQVTVPLCCKSANAASPTLSPGHRRGVPSANMGAGVHWVRDLTKDGWKIPPGLFSYTVLRSGDFTQPSLVFNEFPERLTNLLVAKITNYLFQLPGHRTSTSAVSNFLSYKTCKMSLGSAESSVKSLWTEWGRQRTPRCVWALPVISCWWKTSQPRENMLEELDFVNPNKPILWRALRECCGQFQRSFSHTSAWAAAPTVSQWGDPHAHGDVRLPPEKAPGEQQGAPWLQRLATPGAVVDKSKAEAEGQEKAPGKELQALTLLLCSALHLLSLFVILWMWWWLKPPPAPDRHG